MATDDVLELTDGVTTIDLLRGPLRLAQDGWAPGVARRREGAASGPRWADVEETLRIEVVAGEDDSPGARWTALADLLAQARRWWLGEPGLSPVVLRHRPAGSRLPGGVAREAPVYGGEVAAMHEGYSRLLEAGAVEPVPVTIIRGGLWLDPAPQTGATGSQTSQAVSSAVTMSAAAAAESPTDVCLRATHTVASASETLTYVGLFVADSADADAITMVDAAASMMSGSGTFTDPADAGARGGSYLRVATSSTSAAILSYAEDHGEACDVYMYARANRVYRVQLQLRRLLGGSVAASRADLPEVVTRDDDRPRLYHLGRAAAPVGFSHGSLLVTPTSATSGRLDIDSLIICRHDLGPVTVVIGDRQAPMSHDVFGPLDAMQMLADPRAYPAPVTGQGAQASDFGALSHVTATRGAASFATRGASLRWQAIVRPDGSSDWAHGDARRTTLRLAVRRHAGALVVE
ncbi:MAG: hypothetical protein KBA95_15505 [Acidobacteria bacterium]|nr:hypothetical protein [Acidobacteriota bacterium]